MSASAHLSTCVLFTKCVENVDILDFISVDDHLRAPMILSRSAGSIQYNDHQWSLIHWGGHHPQPRQEQINHFEVHHFPVVF